MTTDELVSRYRAALEKIEQHWGEPMPLDTSHYGLMKKWQADYRELQRIAREALEKTS